MKKCTFLFILCAIFSLTTIAQNSSSWKPLTINEVANNQIKDLYMFDQDAGYIVTEGSDQFTRGLFKTTDGWNSCNMLYNIKSIEKMFVQNQNLLYFCANDKIIKYDNGDFHVKEISKQFSNIYFSSNNIGWLLGFDYYNLYLYKTIDAGDTWNSVPIDLEAYGSGLFATDDNHIWLGGKKQIIHSSNGGSTWTNQNVPIPADEEYGYILDIQMLNNNIGYAVGAFDGVLKTTNGGENWVLQEIPNIPNYSWLTKAFFLSATEGYVVGYYGTVLKTTDGGENWVLQNSGTNEHLQSVFFLDSDRGWIGGDNGFLAYTDRAGEECTINADFTISGHCPTSDIVLENLSTGTPLFDLEYRWKLNGESFSTSENPDPLPAMEAGVYHISLEMEEGVCLSTKNIVWTIYPIDTITDAPVEICEGDSHEFFGEHLSEAGTYYHTLTSSHGCDSVVELQLVVHPVDTTILENAYFCEGTTYEFFEEHLSEAGTYYHTLTSSHGCDSTIQLNLFQNPKYFFLEEYSICQGDVYTWHGQNYNETGVYNAIYTTTHGCDSIYELALTVHPVYSYTEEHSICEGDVYFWHEQECSEAGTYTAEYTTIHGCDSIYTLTLTVNPLPTLVNIIANPTNGILEANQHGSLTLTYSYTNTEYWTTKAGGIYFGATNGTGSSLSLGNLYTPGTYDVLSKTDLGCQRKQDSFVFTEQSSGNGAKIIATPSYGNDLEPFADGAVKVRLYQFTQDINDNYVIVPMGPAQYTVNGNVEFDNLDGEYYLKSELVEIENYPTVIPIYFYDGPTVDSADIISISTQNLAVYINHPEYPDSTGSNTIGGFIIPLGSKSSGIPDQIVILRNETTGQILSVAITDQNGEYFIPKVADNEDVELYVTSFEYQNWTSAGLHTETSTHYTVNFVVEGNSVYPENTTNIQNVQTLNFQIYPNPNNGLVYLENIPENSTLQIFDLQGKLILLDTRSQKTELDISFLPNGQYIVVVSLNGQLGIQKIIKQ